MELLDGTIRMVRKIATELRPSILDDLGLIEAMKWQSQEFEKRSEIKIKFSSSVPDIAFADNMVIALFRIYQESLTNVARHAGATAVSTAIHQEDHRLVLTIADNGKGFDTGAIGNKRTLGLLGMRERAMMIGGHYDISSEPGKGTTVSITVPLKS
jgi:signal transduction histidine kinase